MDQNFNTQKSFDFKSLLKTEYVIGVLAVISALTFFFTTLRIEVDGAANSLMSLVGAREYTNIKISPLNMFSGMSIGGIHASGSFTAIFILLFPVAIAVCAFVKQIREKMGDRNYSILLLCLAAINFIIVFYYPLKGKSELGGTAYISLHKTFGYWVSFFSPIIIGCLAVLVLVKMLEFGSLEFKKTAKAPEVAPAKFCTNCGNKIETDASFCTKCGQKLK
jgi:hypothetical protein